MTGKTSNNNLKNATMKRNKMTYKDVRDLFFEMYPEFKAERRYRKPQKDFSTTCRCMFVDFVDYLCKDEQITRKQADNITLIG